MSYFDFVNAPVSETHPCGPALDGDAGFESYFSSAEGRLPVSFFSFNKADFDVAKELQQITNLLKLSRDVRLMVMAAKFSILAGDTDKFASAIIALADLLEARWEDVHPGGAEGLGVREAHVASLNDLPTVVLPLQYAPLASHRRHGTVSFRSQLIATKAVPIREGEPVIDEPSIRETLLKTEDFDALKTTFAALVKSEAALRQMLAQFAKHTENRSVPDLDKLSGLLSAMTGFLAEVLHERDPTIAAAGSQPEASLPPTEGEAEQDKATPTLSIASTGDAAAALAAIEAYFRRNEPSSPRRTAHPPGPTSHRKVIYRGDGHSEPRIGRKGGTQTRRGNAPGPIERPTQGAFYTGIRCSKRCRPRLQPGIGRDARRGDGLHGKCRALFS